MKVKTYLLEANGDIPNNPDLPLLVYLQAFDSSVSAPDIQERFRRNGWTGIWVNGVFSYHHFHSTAHEVLGCFSGTATLELGGPSNLTLDISAGDALIIPAGVGHKNASSSGDFGVVGAYPPGQDWDLCQAKTSPSLRANIQNVPLPTTDPVNGATSPLLKHWNPTP